MKMDRENRYLVIKRSDLRMAENLLTPEAFKALETLEKMSNQVRANNGKPPLCCVVVESDWPEYEPTWAAIEKRVEKGGEIYKKAANEPGNPALDWSTERPTQLGWYWMRGGISNDEQVIRISTGMLIHRNHNQHVYSLDSGIFNNCQWRPVL